MGEISDANEAFPDSYGWEIGGWLILLSAITGIIGGALHVKDEFM